MPYPFHWVPASGNRHATLDGRPGGGYPTGQDVATLCGEELSADNSESGWFWPTCQEMRTGSAADRGRAPRGPETVLRMSEPGWMASVYGVLWHRIVSAGGSPVGACGHRLRGPVHRRIAAPSGEDGRRPCPECMPAVDAG